MTVLFKLHVGYGSAGVEREIVWRHQAGFEQTLAATGVEALLARGLRDVRRRGGAVVDETSAGLRGREAGGRPGRPTNSSMAAACAGQSR